LWQCVGLPVCGASIISMRLLLRIERRATCFMLFFQACVPRFLLSFEQEIWNQSHRLRQFLSMWPYAADVRALWRSACVSHGDITPTVELQLAPADECRAL
jgi:hypothetical protein